MRQPRCRRCCFCLGANYEADRAGVDGAGAVGGLGPGWRDLDNAVGEISGSGGGDGGAGRDATAGEVCDGSLGDHSECDLASGDDVEHAPASYGNTEREQASNGDTKRNKYTNADRQPDGVAHDFGVRDGYHARTDTDAPAGNEHAQRDPHG